MSPAAAGAVHHRDALINELAEAAHANQLSRALARWERLDLICIDELATFHSPRRRAN
jgi:hypothetical protein